MERVLGYILCHLDPKVKVKVKVMYFLVTSTFGHSNFNLCKCIIRYSYLVTVSPPVVCNVPVPCKADRDMHQLGAWLDSDPIAE